MAKGWTTKEVRQLKEGYSELGSACVPTRSRACVSQQARKYGITYHPHWTQAEDELCLAGALEIQGRTKTAIVQRRKRLRRRLEQ